MWHGRHLLMEVYSGGGGAGWSTFTAEGKGGSGQGPQGTSGPWQYIFCDEENAISAYDDIANQQWIKGGGPDKDGMTDVQFIGPINVNDAGGSRTYTRTEDQAIGATLNDDVTNQNSMFIKDDPVISWAYIEGMSLRDMTTQEAYLFSSYTGGDKEQYQKAYWLLPAGGTTNGGTISGSAEEILAEEAATYENYKNAGVKPLNIYSHDATVSYSYDDEEFLVGPFSVSYTRFFFKINGSRIRKENMSDTIYSNGKVDFAGLVYMQLTLDNGETITLDTDHFVYTEKYSSLHAKDTGYGYPYEEDGKFYIRLSRDEVGDAYKITGLSARYKTVQGSGGQMAEIDSFYATGKLVVSVTEKEKCKDYITPSCGNYAEHGAHTWTEKEWYGTGTYYRDRWGNLQERGYWIYESKSCDGCHYCKHGYCKDCPYIIEVTDSFKVATINDHVDNQKMVGLAGAALVQANETVKTLSLGLPVRMDYEGIVWEDSHTGKMQDQDGLLGAGEKGIEGVKVIIHGTRYGYEHTTYTDANGKYAFKDVKMDQYYATFDYDGQVWEPTTYFAGGEDEFSVNSKAQENAQDRIAFNNKFKEIIEQGGVSPDGRTITGIEYDTKTAGKSFAITNNSYKELSNNGSLKGSDGLQYGGPVEGDYERYKMTATTMEDTTPENTIDGQYNIISYPREDNVHIETWDKTILGTTYTALYQKARQINLGLVRRTAADFEVRKDVYKAIVQINGKTEEYTYSSRDNITESFDIEVKTGPDYGDVEYNRAIYRSDYNYRISDYADGTQLNKDSKANRTDEAGVDDMISAITNAKGTDSELKIYIIYKITIANRSSLYAGTVNELVDYYDEEYTYLESWYGTPTTTENTVVWSETPKYNGAKEFAGYDTLYTQTTAGLMLNSGAMIDIYMKFEVDKHTDETGKTDSIFLDENAVTGEYLGGKNNVVEINNYSTFKPGTTVEQKNVAHLVEGKIDRDSHAGNARADDKSTFEDDTDGAPRMNIILHQSEERSVFGYVWEDLRTETLSTGQIIGNGLREDNETLINGAVVQLIEKVEIDGTTYEYIWREMESGDANLKYLDYDGNLQTGTIYKDENGNDYVWNSEDMSANYSEYAGDLLSGSISAQNGYYFFDKYIPGNYIIRFIYGDNASTIQTAANGGKNAISYNGQDYKSTIYTANEYEVDSIRFYDLASNAERASKARDNAIRRLNVNKYSETMNNHIGNVLAAPYATPNDAALIQELRDNTWMYADTAYINAEIAYNTTGTDLGESQNTTPVYKVENIGVGLEERPRTNIVLTKQIENVTITLVNGTVLVDTANGIRNGIKVVPNVYEHSEQGKKNHLGFWSFEIDDELIQGAELKIYYRLTVDNNGQIDTVGESYNLNNIPSDLREAEAMLGNAYYYGTTDYTRLVTTSIDKILDYIDESIAFNPETESNNGVWYDVENIDDLKAAGLLDAEKVNINDNTSNNTMAMTESLSTTYLNPVNNTTTSTLLVLTKRLGGNSSEYDYTYGNIAEIIQLTNTVGRRDPDQIPGNQDPNIINKNQEIPDTLELENDTDVSEPFTITTPTGSNQSMVIYIVVGLSAAILAVGVVLIKKYVLKK